MRVAMLVLFVTAAMASGAHAELCRISIDEFELPDGGAPRGQMCHHSDDYLLHWQSAWLGCPGGTAPAGLAYAAPVSIQIDSAGDAMDRWWYVYLDRHRYRFLDRTQYNLLGGPSDWRWRYGAWPDVFLLPVPTRHIHEEARPIPEPLTAALLALGAVILLRLRPSGVARNQVRPAV